MTRATRARQSRARRPRVVTLPQLLGRAVETAPSGLAVLGVDADGVRAEATYHELDQRSTRLARVLIARGIGPEDLVALAVPRSLTSVLACWAVAKTGAGFVPVDPNHPEDRVAHMLSDCGAALGITVDAVRAGLPGTAQWLVLDDPATETLLAEQPDRPITNDDRVRLLRPEHPAYVIFTSGSTGLPKGVVVTQAGLASFCAEQQERYRVTERSRTLHFASPSFDASVLELLLAVGGAATMVVVDPSVYGGPDLAGILRTHAVTHAFVTPAALASIDPAGLDELRVVISGGEACPPDLVRRWAVPLPSGSLREFYNGYGPTETTIMTTISDALRPDEPVTIGAPIRTVGAYVLDPRLRLSPPGAVGELYLAGPPLARGYGNRPGLSAARFVANPFEEGARMYRTGDLVRRTPTGALEYLGRNDFQVKIRGFRIELGEIDAVLAAHEKVDFAVTVGHELDHGGTALVAYVHAVDNAALDTDELTELARRRLPAHMVPTAITVLDEIPLTPVGKLDRAALPAPVLAANEFCEPAGPLEETIAAVFAGVLGVERVGADDDFFALGGNSLLAAQAAARLAVAIGAEVKVGRLFETTTVATLAAGLSADAVQADRRPPLTARQRPEHIPLSPAQQRMWLASRIDSEAAVYMIPAAIRLSGELSVPALRQAIIDVVARHEALRTRYPAQDGLARQVIVPADQVVPDLNPEPVPGAELRARIARAMTVPFDLAEEVPVRVALLRLAEDPSQHVLVLVVHHISADGWSMAPVTRDLVVAYAARVAGAEPGWAPLPVQYADFSLWQHEVLGDEADPESVAARQLDHWRTELAGLPDSLPLPFDRPRPAVRDTRARVVTAHLDADIHRALTDLARAEHTTLFMVLHSALAVLLSKVSGTGDLTVGTPFAGRGEQALDEVVGMFVNTLVLRSRVDHALPFTEFLAEQRQTDLAAFANADIPFDRLVEIVNPARSQSRHPLFQVMFALQNLTRPSLELPGLSVSAIEFDSENTEYDLQVTLADGYDADGAPAGIACAIAYRTGLFDQATVVNLVRRFERVLRVVVVAPHTAVRDIDLLDPVEREVVLREWNRTTHEVPRVATVLDLFAESVRRHADKTAVVVEAGESGRARPAELTYAQFAARVNRLARRLIELGVGPDARVAVGMRRSVDMLVAVYAAVTAGGAYVPIDPDQPDERTGYVLDTARPAVLLTTTGDDIRTTVCPVVHVDTADLGDYDDAPIADTERRGVLRQSNIAYVLYTSGSTGRPKGVAVTHAAMVNQLAWRIEAAGLNETDVVMHKTPFTFDASLWELFATPIMGARMILTAPQAHRDARYLTETIHRHRVTLTSFVPTLLAVFASTASRAECASLRCVFVGGEAVTPHVVGLLRGVSPAALVNGYGPTEFTVIGTSWQVSEDETAVPIGRPVWNSRAYVLDEFLHPVAPGVAGELYLGGVQTARGYHARPDLTAQRFVADPFGEPGERLYRTGDLVRWRGNADSGAGPLEYGVLEYIGRTDFQVKFHGQRIELEEIEAALLEQQAIEQAAVQVVGTSAGDHLVAYVVAGEAAGSVLDVEQVKDALRRRLPAYMVPSTVLTLGEFPLNSSGKLDRKALPVPEFRAREYRAPATPVERIVAEVFAEVLDLTRVGAEDDFFELGGNSLIATRVAARLGAALDTRVPVRLLFEASTVAALAARLAEGTGEGARAALVARDRPARVPLSLAQQRMWFLNRFDDANITYNIPVVLRLSGELDVEALRQAALDVMERHEVLRTVYPETDGLAHQVVVPTDSVPLDLAVRRVPLADLRARIDRVLSAPFDVTAEVPVRVRLFAAQERPDEHVLVFVLHHICSDGWSMAPLTRDLVTAYQARTCGQAPLWSPLAVQYADFSLWQHELLGDENDPESLMARQLAYWRSALAGLPDALSLPFDRPRPPVHESAARRTPLRVDAGTHRRLREIAHAAGASLFIVVHTAFAAVLGRWSRAQDVVIGTPVAGRGEAEIDDLIGMFVNTLTLRTRVDPACSFTELLARQRDIDLAAFAHADVPFERLVEALNPPRSQSRHPLFQVMLSFQNHHRAALELPELTVSAMDYGTPPSAFDLHLTLADGYDADGEPAGMDGALIYPVALFDEATMESFARRFERVLAAIAADPAQPVGDIPWLTEREHQAVLSASAGADRPLDEAATLVSLSALGPRSDPRAVAIVDGALTDRRTEISYAEWDSRVHRLARHLVSLGVGPETRVVVALYRSVDLLVAIHAVLRAGGTYVPVDPDHPEDRTAYVLELSKPGCVLTHAAVDFRADGVPVIRIDELDLSGYRDEPITDAERLAPLRPANTAYILFTSGSTGRPKGVAVPHRAVANHVRWFVAEYGMGAADVSLFKTAVTFDMSVWDVFVPFVTGGRVVVAAPDGHRDPHYLAEVIAAERVTVTPFVPSMLRAVVDTLEKGSLDSLRVVWFAGEALSAETALAARRVSRARLDNLYGPTETAVVTMTARVPRDATGIVPIGAPIWNVGAYVLDDRLHPVPVGVAGELYHAGIQLSHGYFGRPDLTAARYVASPFAPGERLYRTGDLVRWLPDGRVEYLGRTDFQVKIRGLRIELGEIETALLAQDDVRQAVVIVYSDAEHGDRLVAYVVPKDGRHVEVDTVRAALRESVPSYMVPAAFVVLDAIPLNASGKLDRGGLPRPEFVARTYREPVTPTQQTIAAVIAEVLGLDRVGLDDDFFAIGGDSISSIQVTARAAQRGVIFSPRDLFQGRTVADLARRARDTDADDMAGVKAGPLVRLTEPDRQRLSDSLPAVADVWPLTPLQSGMLFHALLADTSLDVYVTQFVFGLDGAVDRDRLRSAAAAVVERHENLRVLFTEDTTGRSVQVVLESVEVPWEFHDFSDEPDAGREFERFREADRRRGFSMDVAPLLRFTLLRMGIEDYRLLVTVHHILIDAWSIPLLMRDVLVAYVLGDVTALPPVRPYRDYLAWYARQDSEKSRAAWRSALDGFTEPTPLAPRTIPKEISAGVGAVDIVLSEEQTGALSDLAVSAGVTVNTVFQTVWGLLVGRSVDSDDVVFGATVSGRPPRLAGVESMVGLFLNAIPVRVRLRPAATVTQVLREVQAEQATLLDHHYLGLSDIQEAVGIEDLFDSLLVFESAPIDQRMLGDAARMPGGLSVRTAEAVSSSHYPVTVMVYPGREFRVSLKFLRDVFDEPSVRCLADRYASLLREIPQRRAARIAELDALTAADRAVLSEMNATAVPDLLDEQTLIGLFDAQVERTPQAPAVRFGSETLSYAQLRQRSLVLASDLAARGVGPETLVAVAMRRSIELVVGVYAVLRTGAGYVPIDPDHPAERNDHVLTSAAPVCVLSREADGFDTTTGVPVLSIDSLHRVAAVPLSAPRADNVAYVIYTSGSTGRPKGVAITHRQLSNQFRWAQRTYPHGPGDVVLHKTPITFDISTWELFWPLQTGATVVVAVPDGHRDPGYLARTIDEYDVTTVHFVPSMLDAFLAVAAGEHPRLRWVFAAGEALPGETARRFAAALPKARLVNWYGPAEATVVTAHPVAAETGASVPVGAPVDNTTVHVLDRHLRAVPPGSAGELYVAGVQLARGYAGAPALTAERFVAHRGGQRLYRTGDIVRWRLDGPAPALEYLGRSDFQVKLRGQRVELGEIEAVLLAEDAVAAAVVVVDSDAYAGDRLVGYVVPAAGRRVDAVTLRARASASLPVFMVPSAFVVLEQMPLNASGKVDRRALPAPVVEKAPFRAPETPLERTVVEVFGEVLGRAADSIGVDDSFFESGGNSLVATRAAARLGEEVGSRVPVMWMFTAPTPAALAAHLTAQRVGAADTDAAFDVLLPLRPGEGRPLFCIHPFGGIAWSFAGLAAHLDPSRPIYGLQSPALGSDEPLPESTEQWALRYIQEIRAVQPHGPYHLLGWSLGGVLAHAIAVQLQLDGEQVELLAMMDSYLSSAAATTTVSGPVPVAELLGGLLGDGAARLDIGRGIDPAADAATVARQLARLPEPFASFGERRIARVLEAAVHSVAVTARYRPRLFAGELVYFAAAGDDPCGRGGADTWAAAVDGPIREIAVPATHWRMTGAEGLAVIGRVLDALHAAGYARTDQT
nr:non-ribosomal peptide synthetase [Nocardia shimofusensis]